MSRFDCISNQLNILDVYQSVNYVGSLAKITGGWACTQASVIYT